MNIEDVKGVGPKTAAKLRAANINTAEDLAGQETEAIVVLGIGKTTAGKIIKAAQEIVGVPEKKPEAKEEVKTKEEKVEKPKAEKPKPKKAKKAKKVKEEPAEKELEKVEEVIPEPVEEIIPEEPVVEEKPAKKPKKKKKKQVVDDYEDEPIVTKKKKGIQVRKVKEETPVETASEDEIKSRSAWSVPTPELSEEEIAKREARSKIRSEADKITRDIPTPPEAVKAIKTSKKAKTKKPEKQKKESKKVTKKAKKKAIVTEYWTAAEVAEVTNSSKVVKPRGIAGQPGGSKPRMVVEKGTEVGFVSNHRRSRRNITHSQLIIQLNEEFDSDSLIGKRIVFAYPDTEATVVGRIYKRFAKRSSHKVLAKFEKGIRPEARMAKVYAK